MDFAELVRQAETNKVAHFKRVIEENERKIKEKRESSMANQRAFIEQVVQEALEDKRYEEIRNNHIREFQSLTEAEKARVNALVMSVQQLKSFGYTVSK